MLLNISPSNRIARQSEVFERREKGGGGTNVATTFATLKGGVTKGKGIGNRCRRATR